MAQAENPRRSTVAPLPLLIAAVAVVSALCLGAAQPDPEPEPPPASSGDEFLLDPRDEPEDEHRIALRSGVELEGVITRENALEVALRTGGTEAVVPRVQIAFIEPLAPVTDRYTARRRVIDASDSASMVLLAEWLRDRGAFFTAQQEVERAPINGDARRLARWLRAQIGMMERARERDSRTDETPEGPAGGSGRFPLLSPSEVNLIRVWEIDLRDAPEVIVPRTVAEAFVETYAGLEGIPRDEAGRREFLQRPGLELLSLMFRLRARDFYGQVRVVRDPPALATFRRSVHRMLLNGCATNRCHGGAEAGRLRLATRSKNSDQTVYTNFYLLDNATLPDGTPLINYEDPERSPLLHFGLPREFSDHPHPRVVAPGTRARDWRPIYQNKEDPRFEEAVEWIRGMYSPRPEYGLAYELPGQDKTSEPVERRDR
ncbi:MAG: hypothetical protein AAFU70_01460 [Planctomycetota bacterium]